MAGRGALPPDPRPAGGPGRGLAPQRAKLFASSRNNWRFTAERGALPPDPRPAGGPGRGLGTPPLQRKLEVHCERGALPPDPRPAGGPGRGLALRWQHAPRYRKSWRFTTSGGRCPPTPAPPGARAGAWPSGRACFSPLYRSKLPQRTCEDIQAKEIK